MRQSIDHAALLERLSYGPETGVLTWRCDKGPAKAGRRAGCSFWDGYRRVKIDGVTYQEHRLIWFYVHGRWPEQCLDHIDGNRANNALVNLREATHSQNSHNYGFPSNNTSGQLRVTGNKRAGKWQAAIQREGRRKYIGLFASAEAAGAAYLAAKMVMHPFQPLPRRAKS